LHCELNYPLAQNQSLLFELVALRASEFDIREVRWGWWFEAECWVMCLQPPPTPPFLDFVCQAFGCGYQGGGLFFAAVSSVLSHRHSEGA
jgi:hypothetical protein